MPNRSRRGAHEDARRHQLIEATIDTIAKVGFSATTVAEIARRAEASAGLISFYFGDKDGLLEATLRHLARELSRGLAAGLRKASSPRERVQAVIDANLGPAQFDRRIATVWLAFWGQVPHSPRFGRVQRVYHRRTVSNLVYALRPFMSAGPAHRLAEAIAALIDGLWLRTTLSARAPDSRAAQATATAFVDSQFALLKLPSSGDRS